MLFYEMCVRIKKILQDSSTIINIPYWIKKDLEKFLGKKLSLKLLTKYLKNLTQI